MNRSEPFERGSRGLLESMIDFKDFQWGDTLSKHHQAQKDLGTLERKIRAKQIRRRTSCSKKTFLLLIIINFIIF